MNNWFALHVETGRELTVVRALRRIDIRAIVPMELRRERCNGQMRKRAHVYVPGYVFVHLDASPETYYQILGVPCVFRFLGGGTPDRIPDGQMQLMLALAEHGETGRPAPARLHDGLTTITGGPLARMNPKIISANLRNGRAVIEVKVLQKICRASIQIQLS